MSAWGVNGRNGTSIPDLEAAFKYLGTAVRPKSILSQSGAPAALALCDIEARQALYYAIPAHASSANGIMLDNALCIFSVACTFSSMIFMGRIRPGPLHAQLAWWPASGLLVADIGTSLDSFSTPPARIFTMIEFPMWRWL